MSISLRPLLPDPDSFKVTIAHPWSLQTILAFGIMLRIVVYVFLRPANNDPHGEVIQYLLQHGRLPASDELLMAFHPPLYYLLAAPLAIFGSAKLTQFLSLLLSVATLVLLYRLLKSTLLLRNDRIRGYALLLAAVLPQFVLFSLFVSNDALAIFFGAGLFAAAFRYVDTPNFANLSLLSVLLGMGLLTKGTFAAFLPGVLVIVLIVELRRRQGWWRGLATLFLFAVTALGIGSYKYLENAVHSGHPFPGAVAYDPEWGPVIERQSRPFKGWRSMIDFNGCKLMRNPLNSAQTHDSVPLLLYATFWYSYIRESNFVATRDWAHSIIPRAAYLTGLLPSAVIVVGGLLCLWRIKRPPTDLTYPADDFRLRAQSFLILSALLLHLALVVAWGLMNGGAWSFFQSRLLFPAFFSFATLFGIGWEGIERRWPDVRLTISAGMIPVLFIFTLYYALEIAGCFYRYFAGAG